MIGNTNCCMNAKNMTNCMSHFGVPTKLEKKGISHLFPGQKSLIQNRAPPVFLKFRFLTFYQKLGKCGSLSYGHASLIT